MYLAWLGTLGDVGVEAGRVRYDADDDEEDVAAGGYPSLPLPLLLLVAGCSCLYLAGGVTEYCALFCVNRGAESSGSRYWRSISSYSSSAACNGGCCSCGCWECGAYCMLGASPLEEVVLRLRLPRPLLLPLLPWRLPGAG